MDLNFVDKLCGPWIEYDMADDWFSLLTSLWKRFLSPDFAFLNHQHHQPIVCVTLPGVGCRDSDGISKLPLIQLILPYKVGCIRGSLEIPLLSLVGRCLRV